MVRRSDLGGKPGTGGGQYDPTTYPTAGGGSTTGSAISGGPKSSSSASDNPYAPGGSANPWLDVTDLFGGITGKTAAGKPLNGRVVMDQTLLTQLAADPSLPLYYTTQGKNVMFSTTRTKGARGAGKLGDLFGKGVNGRRTVIVSLQHQMMLLGLYGNGSPTYGVWTPDDQNALQVLSQTVQAQNQTSEFGAQTITTTDYKGKKVKSRTGGATVYAFGQYLKNNALAVHDELMRQQEWAVNTTAAAQPISVTSTQSAGSTFDDTFKKLVGRLPSAAERSQFVASYRSDEIRYGQQRNAATAQDQSGQMKAQWAAQESSFRQAQIDPFIRYNGVRIPASQVPFQDRARVKQMYPGLDYAAIDEFYRTHPRGGGSPGASPGVSAVIEQPDLQSAAEAAAKKSPMYMPNQIGSYGQDILRLLSGGGGPVGALGVQGG